MESTFVPGLKTTNPDFLATTVGDVKLHHTQNEKTDPSV